MEQIIIQQDSPEGLTDLKAFRIKGKIIKSVIGDNTIVFLDDKEPQGRELRKDIILYLSENVIKQIKL